MQRTRRHLRGGTWLALIALWWLALAPALVRIHAANDPLAWVPVCTSQGLVQGQTAVDGTALPNPAENLRVDAALTATLQAPVHAVAAETVSWVGPTPASDAPAVTAAATPGPTPVWAGALARAPPVA